MDVIGAGFGRTGTLSLKAALEHLGFDPCMHMVTTVGDPDLVALLNRATTGDRDALEAAMKGYRATVDWPGAYFWRELADLYPEAKVVLTVRDPEKWYESAEKTIYRFFRGGPRGGDTATYDMIAATVWNGALAGEFADREATLARFERHNAEVRAAIDPARLLVFEVAQGWEPLCSFLGVPAPSMPFPRVNDAASFAARWFEPEAAAH